MIRNVCPACGWRDRHPVSSGQTRSVCPEIAPGQGMEREGTSKKCRPGLAHGLFEALDRHGQRQQEDQMAKKSKKGKKAKKAKKAVVAKKKSAKKASKKAAKKSAKKAAKKGAKKSAKKAAKKSKARPHRRRPQRRARQRKGRRLPSPPLPRRSPRWRRQSRNARTGAELGYPGAVHTLMGVRLVQRRRPQLDGRLPGTTFRKGRSVHRCGLFRAGCPGFVRAVPRRPEPCFHGEVDSQKASSGMSPAAAFSGSRCCPAAPKPQKLL